jgi:hypothetical protein
MTDETSRRLRSLLLALAPWVRLDAPLALQEAMWREAGDELLREHAALLRPDPARIIGSGGSTIH